MRDRNAAGAVRLTQGDFSIAQRLGPTDRRRVLRTYAAALGLDSAGLAYRFTGDTAEGEDDCPEDDDDTDAAAEPPDVAPAPTFRWGAAALVGLILAAGAGAGWYALPRPGEPPGEAAPATKLLPAPAIPEASRSAPAGAPSLPDPDEAVAASAAPAQEAQPAEAAPALPVALIAPASVPAAQTPAPENTAPAADPPSAPPSGGEEWRLVLRAKADTWLQVRSRSGQVLLSRTLHEGEVWPVPPEPDLVLSTGNAGGTELVVDGVTAPSIGNPGAVRRNLPLDPDLIRDGKLPAQQKAAASAQPPGEQPASP